MRGQPGISAVYRQGPRTAPDAEEAFRGIARVERLRRAAWHEHGIVAVTPDELPPHIAGLLRAWAEDRYGAR